MYRINYPNGTQGYEVNLTEACRKIQSHPRVNWIADIGDWIGGVCTVRLNGRIIATITAM